MNVETSLSLLPCFREVDQFGHNFVCFPGYKAYEEGQYSPTLIRFSDVDQVHDYFV